MNTWEKFYEEFKKAFFPYNVIYEAKRKFRELDEDMLFHFLDGLQSWDRTELQRRQVGTIDEAIT